MGKPTNIQLLSDEAQATVEASDCENLEELEEELAALASDAAWSVSLWLEPPTTISLADAAHALRRAIWAHRPEEVRVRVRPGRSWETVESILGQVVQAPVTWQRGGVRIELLPSSLTEIDADVAVNASNTQLRLGAGVSGALARACGPKLQVALSVLAPIAVDGWAVTPSFDHHRVRSILHVPTASGGLDVVQAAYQNVLRLSLDRGWKRIVLPSLGTGTGGLPPEVGARLFLEAVRRLPGEPELELRLAVPDAAVFGAFRAALVTT